MILSFVASQFTTVVLFGQSAGLYDHYFNTFLNPIDLLWSFLQAILMAIAILLIHTYFGYFATGGPPASGPRGGQRGAHLADRGRVGHPAHLAVHLRLQRQLQPVGVRERTADERASRSRRWRRLTLRPRVSPGWTDRYTTLLGLCSRSSRIVAVAVGLFRGSFTETVPVTVISQRAGLVMNPDAKVKMRGVQVGKVASIEIAPDGKAAMHLAMDPVAAASHSGQRARRHRVVDGVRRQVRRAGPTAEPVGAAAARRPGA